MAESKQVYLGKNGKIFGPISLVEFERLKVTREIEKYTFIWDSASHAWNPIEEPPPELSLRPSAMPSWTNSVAICHNFTQVITGKLRNVTDAGCELVTHDKSDAPRMGLSSTLLINVVDPKTEKGMNVKAILSDVARVDGLWIYRISWEHAPKF